MKSILYILAAIVILPLSCSLPTKRVCQKVPKRLVVPAERQIFEGKVTVHFGGYGSAMAFNSEDSTFWLLTDRGPNVDGVTSVSKVFVYPDYIPCIGVFKWQRDSLFLLRKILLKDQNGSYFNGLPNVSGNGMTGETAYDTGGNVIPNTQKRGLDPEGLALAPDGSFWISDEYGPYLIHFNAQGEWLEELSPFNGRMPVHYAKRRPNRGMEGLCMNTSGSRLYGILQAPLDSIEGALSLFADHLPLFVYSLTDSTWNEYAYPLDNGENGVSELCFVNDSTLWVLERDGRFPDEKGKSCKLIYEIILPVTSSKDIVRLKKTRVLDIVEAIPGYSHDKAEGICFINDTTFCVVNDDDFGINSPERADGSVVPKLNAYDQLDVNVIYIIPCHR